MTTGPTLGKLVVHRYGSKLGQWGRHQKVQTSKVVNLVIAFYHIDVTVTTMKLLQVRYLQAGRQSASAGRWYTWQLVFGIGYPGSAGVVEGLPKPIGIRQVVQPYSECGGWSTGRILH